MYRHDSEDYEFWSSEASDAHQWAHMVHTVIIDVYRRRPGDKFQLLDELDRAQKMFDAYYHYAVARRDLATQEIPMAEMLATQ